jgi:PPP family 3-phenylpropionic acid transporter
MPLPFLLSFYWFLLLGGLGVFFPFYSLYLNENLGFDGTRVGLVMAAVPMAGIAAQPLWGYVGDRTGSRTRLLSFLSIGAAAGYALLYTLRSFPAVLAGTAILALASSAVIPMCVSVSFALLKDRGPHAFGFVRVWGTVGFLSSVVLFPWLLDRFGAAGAGVTLASIFPATALLCFAAGIVATSLPGHGAVALRSERGDARQLARHPPFFRLLVFVLLCYLFLQGPMGLFPLYVRSLGGDVSMIGRMWVFMLVLEIPLIMLSGAGFRRLGPRGLLGVGIASGSIRWLVSGLATDIRIIYAVQVLHGVTVTGLIIGAPLYMEAVVPARLRSTGQSLLSMVGISVGGILSNTAAGWLLAHVGPRAPAVIGGIGGLLLTCALPLLVPRAERIEMDEPAGPEPVEGGEMP